MSNAKKLSKAGIAVLILVSSFNLTACGGRIKAANPAATQASTAPTPSDNFYDETPAADISSQSVAPPPATPNTQVGTFKTDQDFLNSWQAKGIAVSGGTIYLTVADTSGLSKKGSVVKMSSSDGKSWKEIATKYVITHPLSATVEGIAVNGSTIVAVDSASNIYTMDTSGNNIKTIKGSGGKDVTSAAGTLYISNGAVEKTDTSGTSRAAVTGLTASGGVGSDTLGNVYAVSGVTIKKADATGQVQDLVTTDLTSPIDVAADSRNGDIYVLDGNMIKRFNSSGQILSTFSSGASKPVSIAVDESGAVYVADQGSDYKDSKVIKFAASADAASSSSVSSSSLNSYSSSSSNDYATYSNTKAAISSTKK